MLASIRHRARAWTTLTAAAAAGLLATGCGTWVNYPDDYEPPTTATLDDFPDVTRCNHLGLDALLAQHTEVTTDGLYVLVDYDALAEPGESRYLFDQYLAMVNTIDPGALDGPGERLAYWINGYNASVIQGVLSRYDGDPGFSVSSDFEGFFGEPAFAFGGVLLSLNQVEHGVLRGDWDHDNVASADADTLAAMEAFHDEVWDGAIVDARIHVGLNCASLGCPNLRAAAPNAYKPYALDEQLDEMSVAFVNNPQKGAGPDGISSIFDWYGVDFDAGYGGVEGFIDTYRDGGSDGVDLDTWLPYDWSLNITQ